MSLTHLLVPTFSNQLNSLAQWLEKASFMPVSTARTPTPVWR